MKTGIGEKGKITRGKGRNQRAKRLVRETGKTRDGVCVSISLFLLCREKYFSSLFYQTGEQKTPFFYLLPHYSLQTKTTHGIEWKE